MGPVKCWPAARSNGTHIGVWPQVGQYELPDSSGGGVFSRVMSAGQRAAGGFRDGLGECGLS